MELLGIERHTYIIGRVAFCADTLIMGFHGGSGFARRYPLCGRADKRTLDLAPYNVRSQE